MYLPWCSAIVHAALLRTISIPLDDLVAPRSTILYLRLRVFFMDTNWGDLVAKKSGYHRHIGTYCVGAARPPWGTNCHRTEIEWTRYFGGKNRYPYTRPRACLRPYEALWSLQTYWSHSLRGWLFNELKIIDSQNEQRWGLVIQRDNRYCNIEACLHNLTLRISSTNGVTTCFPFLFVMNITYGFQQRTWFFSERMEINAEGLKHTKQECHGL